MTEGYAVAVVGIGAILPDAPDASTFWDNVANGHYAISDVQPSRWDPDLYYDEDHKAPDKSYSKIGGWVRAWEWDPLAWHLPVPPKVGDAMDDSQKWAVACARSALVDYGWPERPIDGERTAVILGNALSGEQHYLTSLRIAFPEFARELEGAQSFAALPDELRAAILAEVHLGLDEFLPEITEDTMPGELGNCMAGRVANLFDLHGPNYVVDAACASAMAAFDASVAGLLDGEFDTVVTGGVDRNMGATVYVKFCKIGALSATGTRPFAAGADGFVMGEGAAVFVLKRLADAERDGDRVYAVLRGIGGASDGRGKGLTAPNPVGQQLAMERAWRNAGLSPGSATLVEGHGTSTRVGDTVEVESLNKTFGDTASGPGSIALGSVKSNIGHLKAAAGAAGILKTVLALHHKVLPPSLHFDTPNPNVEFGPFAVNTELREWNVANGVPRRAGVSAFGFGGTNFHVILEEHRPGVLIGEGRGAVAVGASLPAREPAGEAPDARVPLRGALVLGAGTEADLLTRLEAAHDDAAAGRAPAPAAPLEADLRAAHRIAIDFADAAELADKTRRALDAAGTGDPRAWKLLRGRGVYRGAGPAPKLAFLFTGQGSQYANMLAGLRAREPIVAETFADADRVMTPLLGRPLTDYIFVDSDDADAVTRAEEDLRQTEITQPAVLATDLALTRLLAAYGIVPDLVMGHSLGEYGALVAAGGLGFDAALEAVSSRGRGMASLLIDDPGAMAAVFAPLDEVERIAEATDGYVVVANVNCMSQAVIGGATEAVERAVATCEAAGFRVARLPVSHAFHTDIVAPVSEPLRAALEGLGLSPPITPIVANVSGDFYPMGPDAEPEMLDILARQVASPVQFVRGLHTLFDAGARVFVEVGPKRALQGFAADVLGEEPDMLDLCTNLPGKDDATIFNQALCGLYAAGLGTGNVAHQAPRPAPETVPAAAPVPAAAAPHTVPPAAPAPAAAAPHTVPAAAPAPAAAAPAPIAAGVPSPASGALSDSAYVELGHLFADFLDQGRGVVDRAGRGPASTEPVVITGAALGLPGTDRVFDDENVGRLLHGTQLIDVIPTRLRHEILEKHVTRLVKRETGEPSFETIDDPSEVIKLAARAGEFDLEHEFGVPAERAAALGHDTELAIGAGIDALRDAGIPLVMRYKTTTTGSQLPERWGLPDALRDDTGVIFASAFPGFDSFAEELAKFWTDHGLHERLADVESLRALLVENDGQGNTLAEIDRRIHDLRHELDEHGFTFDRRFLFRVLSMGHSQFADLVGARGPNTQVNSACASTTQAVGLADDWIRAGRCRRVVIVAADDVTSDHLLGWVGTGFLASGAAATDAVVEEAALPFDQRRHGMILGMGAAALVVERADAARERGISPICEVLGAVMANSAFHGTRLDVEHIGAVMESLVEQAEARGVRRHDLAPATVFISHETYTPARGGSASAEIHALREVFGDDADRVVIANTKGFTGHPMGVGIEDVVAVKALETGIVPPVANFQEVDPELGPLNLSTGGAYPVEYALRLAAGFGSQIAMTLLHRIPVPDGRRRAADELGYEYRIIDGAAWAAWLRRVTRLDAPELEVVDRRLRVIDKGPGAPAWPTTEPVAEPVAVPTATAPVPPPAPTEPATPLAPAMPVEPATPLAPAMPVEPAAAVADGADPVLVRVLEVVAANTGYPPDMLDAELDLEADLGIDTVKQAEIFANIRESYGIERDDKLKLRDYPTLAHVVAFVHDNAPQTNIPASTEAAPATAETAPPTTGAEPSAFTRRVPVAVLRPPLEWCAPTGVALGAGSRVVVMPDRGGVAASLIARLEKLGVETLVLEGAPTVDELEAQLASWAGRGAVHGVYWLPALDDPDAVLDPAAWREGLHVRVKLLAVTMRALADDVRDAGTFLVSATRLGGRHGYDRDGAREPMGGAVTGFTKALARERPDALVKVIDVAPSRKTAALADTLMAETTTDPGAVEVGYADSHRWGVGLHEEPAQRDPARSLAPDSVFVVTGAAGSIVAAIVADLATAAAGTFHLLDLTPEPDPGDPDLERLDTDRDGLKRDLAERIKERGQRATPALVERELGRLERSAAARQAIDAVQAAGGTACWHQVDLTDAAAVAAVIDAVRAAHDHVDVLVHAAGIEVSHQLPDKPQAEYDLVFDVKANGWFHLLHALGDTELGAAVVFSSIAGRFGNAGQTDYSAANDLLCKSISGFRTTRPGTRGIAIDWTAWRDIGMASRGSIPTMMAAAGIDMLPSDEGIPVVRRELAAAGAGGEVLVARALGVLVEERHAAGGVDPDAAGNQTLSSGPLVGAVAGFSLADGLLVTTRLDPAAHGFLRDHRIDGTAVLPGVMGIEAFAEVAALMTPDLVVTAIEAVDFLAPVKFYRDEPRVVELSARPRLDGDALVVDCALVARRTLASGEEQATLHFTGRAALAREQATPETVAVASGPNGAVVDADAIYGIFFHGPAYRVLDAEWRDAEHAVGRLTPNLPANHEPADQPTRTAPRLVELCFQTAGVLELGTTGRMALPTHVDRVESSPGATDTGPRWAVVTPRPGDSKVDAVVVDDAGTVLVRVEGYEKVDLPILPADDALAPLRAAMG
ncbi:MAG TPA: SDR family NAD(P)-dependent oxidoreductase [Acidimicrobiia bacterium]